MKRRYFIQHPSGQWLETNNVVFTQARTQAIAKKVPWKQRFLVYEDPNPPLFKDYKFAKSQVIIDSMDALFKKAHEMAEKEANTVHVCWDIRDGYLTVYKCERTEDGAWSWTDIDWVWKTKVSGWGDHWNALRRWVEDHPDHVFVRPIR